MMLLIVSAGTLNNDSSIHAISDVVYGSFISISN